MIRADMISTVGRKYLTSNIENDEYSYPKAFSAASLPFVPVRNNNGRAFENWIATPTDGSGYLKACDQL